MDKGNRRFLKTADISVIDRFQRVDLGNQLDSANDCLDVFLSESEDSLAAIVTDPPLPRPVISFCSSLNHTEECNRSHGGHGTHEWLGHLDVDTTALLVTS